MTAVLVLVMAAAAVLNRDGSGAVHAGVRSQVPELGAIQPGVAAGGKQGEGRGRGATSSNITSQTSEEGPIVGPGPCTSDTPHFLLCPSGVAGGDPEWVMVNGQLLIVTVTGMTG